MELIGTHLQEQPLDFKALDTTALMMLPQSLLIAGTPRETPKHTRYEMPLELQRDPSRPTPTPSANGKGSPFRKRPRPESVLGFRSFGLSRYFFSCFVSGASGLQVEYSRSLYVVLDSGERRTYKGFIRCFRGLL